MENSGIKKVYAKITVDKVEQDQYKADLFSAQIRQIVTKVYPSASISNNMQDSLFSADKFDLEGSEFNETRVCWISVPKGTTAEQVQAQLDSCPNAKIYKVLAHEPILSDGQEYALEKGLTDLATFENAQLVKDNDGNPILDEGAMQYSAKYFSKEGKDDEDRRTSVPSASTSTVGDLAAK